MSDNSEAHISAGDLRTIYAQLNAHYCILRSIVRTLNSSNRSIFEKLRHEAMETADILTTPEKAPDKEFIEKGRIETLDWVRDFFAKALSS